VIQTMQSNLFYCRITLHVSGDTPLPEAAVTVFSTPDDGCRVTRNM